MSRKISVEERLQRLAEETKRLKQKQKEEERRKREALFALLGKATAKYFQAKSESEEISKAKLYSFANPHLSKTESKKLQKLLNLDD